MLSNVESKNTTRIGSRSGGRNQGQISFPSRRDIVQLGLTGEKQKLMDQVSEKSDNRDLTRVSTQRVILESTPNTSVFESPQVIINNLPNFASIDNIRSEAHTQQCAVYGKAYARKGLTVPTWSRQIEGKQRDVIVGKLHQIHDCKCHQMITQYNVQTGDVNLSKHAEQIGIDSKSVIFIHSTQWDEQNVHTKNWKSRKRGTNAFCSYFRKYSKRKRCF
jgi:hypothetical protein